MLSTDSPNTTPLTSQDQQPAHSDVSPWPIRGSWTPPVATRGTGTAHSGHDPAGMVVRQYVFFLRTSRPALSLKSRFAPNAHCKDPVKYICLRPSARRHLGPAVRFAISTILRSTARILNIRCTCDRIGYCSGRSPLYGSALPGTACQPALFTA